ncbi:MAG: SurA N-terminal domain-containing protein [Nitrospinae bacterium]|nr:SurA N-terminal domain-containing protein [Nitrospinota bacterium]
MLEYLRDSAKGWILKGLMVIIAASFVVWGVWGREDSADDIGSVDGKPITVQEYSRSYDNIYNLFKTANNGNIEGNFWKDLISKQAIQSIIVRRLQLAEANKLGIKVSDAELSDRIHQQKMFQTDGQFDQNLYKNILRANRLDAGEYESGFRSDIKLNKLRDVITGAIFVSAKEAEDEYRYASEKITLDYISLEPAYFQKLVQFSEEDIIKHYNTNKNNFMVEEKIEAELLVSDPADYLDTKKPDDKKVSAYYDKHLDKFYLPKRIRARHILIKVAPDADKKSVEEAIKKGGAIIRELEAGKDFAILARKYSDDPSAINGGDLGFFVKGGGMIKEFEDAAFALKEGETSYLVRTQFGFHIIKAEEIREEGVQPLADIRPTIEAEVIKEEAQKMAKETLAEIKNKERVNTDSFENIAKKYKSVRVEKVTLTKNDPIHNVIAGRAFGTGEDKVSGVITEGNIFYILKVNNKIAAFVPPLKDVRGKVEEAYRETEWPKLAEIEVPKLLEKLKKGRDLNALAKELRIIKKHTDFVRRGDKIPDIGAESSQLLSKVFTAKVNQFDIYKGQHRYFIFQVRGKLDAKMDDFNNNKEVVIKGLTQRKRNNFYMEWLQKEMEQALTDKRVKISKKYQ